MALKININKTKAPLPSNGNCGEYRDKYLIHICEVCGKRKMLTPEEGYKNGWDYAPYMYPFSVISPRTCGDCGGLEGTLWWELITNKTPTDQLSERHQQTLKRILAEPESILP